MKKVLILMAVLTLLWLPAATNAVAFAEESASAVEAPVASEGVEEVSNDYFTRFAEWLGQNKATVLDMCGVLITLVILPLLKNLRGSNNLMSASLKATDSGLQNAVSSLGGALSEVQTLKQRNDEMMQKNDMLSQQIEKLNTEVQTNSKLMRASLNSLYTAFMGSNVSDGVKSMLATTISAALSYDEDKQVAKTQLSKAKELMNTALETVETIGEALTQEAETAVR